jgi:hypothetical protein
MRMILRADAYYPSHKYELRRRKIKIVFSKTKWKVKNFEPHSRHSAQLMPQMFTGLFFQKPAMSKRGSVDLKNGAN